MTKLRFYFITSCTLGVALMAAGCGIKSPTYGTSATASEQLVTDIVNMAHLKAGRGNDVVNTKPRPVLVPPRSGQVASLPVPQANVAQLGSPDWPESPEQMRARLRQEATLNQGNGNYTSPISGAASPTRAPTISATQRALKGAHRGQEPDSATLKKQREEFLRLKKLRDGGGDGQTRKYLSQPPLTYFEPSPSAPVGEKGTDEAVKERKNKALLKSGGK